MREPDFANWFKQFEEFFYEIRDSHSPGGEIGEQRKSLLSTKNIHKFEEFFCVFDVMKGFVRKSGD